MTKEHSSSPGNLRVLLTGASGRVATRITPFLAGQFELRLTDVRPMKEPKFPFTQADLRDPSQLAEVVKGVDAVVHAGVASRYQYKFVAKPRNEEEERQEQAYHLDSIDVNAKGTYNLFRAAKLAGVRRIVYVSSLTVALGRDSKDGYPEQAPPHPSGVYGCTKLFGELLGEVFSREYGMIVICLRLGQPYPFGLDPLEKERKLIPEVRGALLGLEDVAHAIACSLKTTRVQFGAYNIVSESPWRTIDISAAARDLGYVPRLMCDDHGDMVPVEKSTLAPNRNLS